MNERESVSASVWGGGRSTNVSYFVFRVSYRAAFGLVLLNFTVPLRYHRLLYYFLFFICFFCFFLVGGTGCCVGWWVRV